jgi:hypothetical protein
MARFIQERDEWTADEFYRYAMDRGIIGKVVIRNLGNLLKGFSSNAAGVIVKTDKFKASKRNAEPCPVWATNK